MRDKLHCREGNNPDHQLRSLNPDQVIKDVKLRRQLGCWLRSSHSFKECVTAHQSSGLAPIISGTKPGTEAMDAAPRGRVVGERSILVEGIP